MVRSIGWREVFKRVLACEQMKFESLDQTPLSPAPCATAYLEAVKWAGDSLVAIAG
ncbi:MAG: hypothetical protein WD668_10900 [Saccharospirillum sp.]